MSVYEPEQLEKLQSIELDMLKVVDAFCREHEITYVLIAGTALGAARHQGFIPWDDDIDIAMMRDDFERFCALFESNPPGGFSLHTHNNTQHFPYMFAKVYREGTRFMAQECIDSGLESCIYLDVYPFDYVDPALSREEAQALIDKAMFWQRMLYMGSTPHPAVPPTDAHRRVKLAVGFLGHYVTKALLSEKWLQQKFDDVIARLSKGGSSSSSSLVACPQDETCVLVRDLLPPSSMKFEDGEFPGPHDPDAFLASIFGDWRQLPPEGKRKTHAPVILDFGDL